MSRPIVFTTDYGLADEFVGICHGVIARIAPDARIIDLTHAIPRQDVIRGALALLRAIPYMPADAVYLAVVDPGVGSPRRAIATRSMSGADLVGPDNGVLSLAWEALGGLEAAAEVTSSRVLLEPVSRTFHGRDVFAPAAAHLASGASVEELGPPLDLRGLATLEIPRPMVTEGAIGARVIAVDGFGNVQLNVRSTDLEAAGLGTVITVAGRELPRAATFADVPSGSLAAIIDSNGHLALVVNQGKAADVLGLSPGRTVVLE